MKKLILPLLLRIGSFSWGQTGKFHSGFIFHFTKYLEWPENMRTGDFVIAIVGKNDATPYLEQLAAAKTIGLQKLVIKKYTSISEVSNAHMIYLSDDRLSADFKAAVALAKSKNAVLMTDEPNYGKYGSMINFTEIDGKVQFELNQGAVNQTKVKVSQQLVKLAIVL